MKTERAFMDPHKLDILFRNVIHTLFNMVND